MGEVKDGVDDIDFVAEEGEKLSSSEIERKFLVKELPDNLDSFPSDEIRQGYLPDPAENVEERVRQKGDKYFHTIKSGSGLEREEQEEEISQEQFEQLWNLASEGEVAKKRFKIEHEGAELELDVYSESLDGLVVVEVEFADLELAKSFEAPDWFGDEVTGQVVYSNRALAAEGLPEEEQIEYELAGGVEMLTRMIDEKMSGDASVVVQVAGGSASGKTSEVAAKIKEQYGEGAILLSMDDYYRGIEFMDEQAAAGNELNWDQPEALDLEMLRDQLAQLKNGETIKKPLYDFQTGSAPESEEISPAKVIIVEGLFALNEKVSDVGDVKAFVEVGTHGRMLRRLLRDVERTGQDPKEILNYFISVVEPMHQAHIQATRGEADIVISNEYSPQKEAEKSGQVERQVKYQTEEPRELITKLGAERLATISQVDDYYQEQRLSSTKEMVRVRKDGGQIQFSYKGPEIDSGHREKSKFEFEIDQDTEGLLSEVYGEAGLIISKTRTLYRLGGIVLSDDRVSAERDGESFELGSYLEVRLSDNEEENKAFRDKLEEQGVDLGDEIKSSYLDIALGKK